METTEQIFRILQQHTTGGELALPAGAFGKGRIKTALEYHFGTDGVLNIRDAEMEKQEEQVLVRGAGLKSGSNPLFENMRMECRFFSGPDDTHLQLQAARSEGWQWGMSFPDLSDTFPDDLQYENVLLALDTSLPPGEGRSLTLTCTIKLGSYWGSVLWLFKNTDEFPVSGTIEYEQGIPVFSIEKLIKEKLTVGVFRDLQISAVLFSRILQSGNDPDLFDMQFGFGIRSKVAIPGVQGSIPLFFDISSPLTQIEARLETAEVGRINLASLASLLNGSDLLPFLPRLPDFNPADALVLREMNFSINPRERKLTLINVEVDCEIRWNIGNTITVDNISLGFTVVNPMEPEQRQVSAHIEGEVQWPGGVLVLGATLPGAEFFAALEEDSRVMLRDLLDIFLPGTGIGGELYLAEFDFFCKPSACLFEISTGIEGEWELNLGYTRAALKKSYLSLRRDREGTGGTIAASAEIAGITFEGSWELPGNFQLTGKFPDINFNILCERLTGFSPPAELPEISITEAAAGIEKARGTDNDDLYTFFLKASATANRENHLGTLYFLVRKNSRETGYLAGFHVPDAWSPAALFGSLDSLFRLLEFRNTGLIISSMDSTDHGLAIPGIPDTIQKGVTVYTDLQLQGTLFSLLGQLFSAQVNLKLLAVINPADPLKSKIEAVMDGSRINGDLNFRKLVVAMDAQEIRATVELLAEITLFSEKLGLAGHLSAGKQALDGSLLISDWHNPLGISGLVINQFGLGFQTQAGSVSLKFLGSFTIGRGNRVYHFLILGSLKNFKTPDALGFRLDAAANPLMLSDLIEHFVPDLKISKVPVLSDIGFAELEFMVVLNPRGFSIGNKHFNPGIRVKADIRFFGLEAVIDFALNTKGGLYAKGQINKKIDLGNGLLVISDYAGEKGPSFLIDTAAFLSGSSLVDRAGIFGTEMFLQPEEPAAGEAADYLEMSAAVRLLKIASQRVLITASRDTLDFRINFDFLVVKADLQCALNMKELTFRGQGDFSFGLDIPIPALTIKGITIIPSFRLRTPKALIGLGVSLKLSPPPGGSLSVKLGFDFMGKRFDVHFSLSLNDIGNSLNNLWEAVKRWLANNVAALFKNILSSLSDFLAAIKDGLINFGRDIIAICRALIAQFRLGAEAVAQALKYLGFAFMEITRVIVKFFGILLDKAFKIVEGVFSVCSPETAQSQLSQFRAFIVNLDDILLDNAFAFLPATGTGQQLLLVYYTYREEIDTLLYEKNLLNIISHDQFIGEEMKRQIGNGQYIPLLLEIIACLEIFASSGFRKALAEVRPMLMEFKEAGYADFVQQLYSADAGKETDL